MKKNIINQIKLVVATVVMGMGVSSCSLDLLPLNEVVLENYWTNKADVESVVNSCYVGMQENGYVSKMIEWGEVRSDNTLPSSSAAESLRNFMNGSIKSTSSYCDWSSMYNVINRCNTVLYYAKDLAEEGNPKQDPNYTMSDYNINVAECKALRALSYLTLIKTFKDVPFTLDPSIDDDVDYRLGQTKFEVILDSLIEDIESCKDFAPRRYAETKKNSGRITRAAMYALLAEMYLWRASDANLTRAQQNEYYRKCIECCDWVIDYKVQQYNENNIDGLDLTSVVERDIMSRYGYPLLKEEPASGVKMTGPAAYNSIFGTGNSFESIFEVTYTQGSSEIHNTDVSFYYGGKNKDGEDVQYIVANTDLLSDADKLTASYNAQTLFPSSTDYRILTSFHYQSSGAYDIYKYVVERSQAGSTDNTAHGSVGSSFKEASTSETTREYEDEHENWIIYRLTEIMLFRAEAEIELAYNLSDAEVEAKNENTETEENGEADENAETDENAGADEASKARRIVAPRGQTLTTSEELRQDAYYLILAVYLRSNPYAKTSTGVNTAAPSYTGKESRAEMETLVLNERRREFLFEGKRYYDLVRQSRRDGNTSAFKAAIGSKYTGASIKIKMNNPDFMYMPILKSQLKVNPNLVQNSAYNDEREENAKN